MPSFLVLATLLAVLTTHHSFASNEDFAFDVSEDVEEITNTDENSNPSQKFTATVGRIFHFAVYKETFGNDVAKFQAKQLGENPLPSWLLFDKIEGVFWGVPLKEDQGSIYITVRGLGGTKSVTEHFITNVVQDTFQSFGVKLCPPSEDTTVLTLLLDRGVAAIKPKQRVVAISDIAKFFGLPSSAFTLKAQDIPDDITDSSVVLAGPGNLQARSSKLTSLLDVPVGCDGRLWVETTTLIHQLKQQAKDGTLSEVLRLPLIGWRVKTETRSLLRSKRKADDFGGAAGSGDYEDYYDDYEDEEYDEDEDGEDLPKSSKKSTTTHKIRTSTTLSTSTPSTTPVTKVTHHHRHHHGQPKTSDEVLPELEINNSDLLEENDNDNEIFETTSMQVSPTTSSTTSSITTTTRKQNPTTSSTTEIPHIQDILTEPTKAPVGITSSSTKSHSKIPDDVNYDLTIDDYDEDDEEDNEDEDGGPIESETLVPIPRLLPEDHHKVAQSEVPVKETTTETEVAQTVSIDEVSTPAIVEDYEPDIQFITEVPVHQTPSTSASTTTTTSTKLPEVTTTTTTTTAMPITTTELTTTPITTTTISTTTTTTTTFVPLTIAPVPSTTTTTTTTTAKPDTTTMKAIVMIPTTAGQSETEEEEEGEETDDQYLDVTTRGTTLRHIYSTTPYVPQTTIREIPEVTVIEQKNFKPYIENRLEQKYVYAGKIFRYVIPENTFNDLEDGSNLRLEFLDAKENPIDTNSWCQFNSGRREVYGLPLEEDVSKWTFIIKATDSYGESVKDNLTIQVQQHKMQRAVNHEFTLQIRIEKQDEFRHFVDWSLKTLRALGRIYNTNMSEITVRKVNFTSQPVVFTWTNDSLPTNYCPKTEIEKLFKVITANDRGDPSRELSFALAPELRVKKVTYRGLGVCAEQQTAVTPPMNYPPILRNPVDRVNATVGELLVFKVPEDTFYDPEDVDNRALNITLLTSDRKDLPTNNWLQFDSKNREFYGIPRKTERTEYQLICVDSGGLPVGDSLEIVVTSAAKIHYNVEFSMTLEIHYDTFINSASLQKKFVEKLMDLFDDKNTSHFHFNPFRQKHQTTIATWFNKSLPIEKCDHDEINRLESVLKNNDRGIAHHVHSIMEPEFPISTIQIVRLGTCKSHKSPPPVYKTPTKYEGKIGVKQSHAESHVPTDVTKQPNVVAKVPKAAMDESVPSSSDNYLVTFIVPAIIIAVMLFLAIGFACFFYRRRRTGKMSVEEGGRQNYGNKGIPVIFQEELEEKPEAGTKAPVILKDEKPPLAPPEYSKSGSLKMTDDSEPYQPPPPFTRTQDNGKQSRPKPAPTYRKPPPYVPP